MEISPLTAVLSLLRCTPPGPRGWWEDCLALGIRVRASHRAQEMGVSRSLWGEHLEAGI